MGLWSQHAQLHACIPHRDSFGGERHLYRRYRKHRYRPRGAYNGIREERTSLFLGSYPITPATDILHELAKRKDLGVKACQMEDEIAGVCSAIGASYAGHLAVTSTSGLRSCVEIGGYRTCRHGRASACGYRCSARRPLNRSSYQNRADRPHAGSLRPQRRVASLCVLSAVSPTDCFEMAFQACRIAIEHMTPVILLTDAFIGNGSSAWRVPEKDDYPEIKVPLVSAERLEQGWKPYDRDNDTLVRYWSIPAWKKACTVWAVLRKITTHLSSRQMPGTTHVW